MLIPIISHYLETHKRLVVPQLGAFIVKEPEHTVLFSELLKRDDGILRGLLQAAGLQELEAAGEIDRFVFEVRHAVEHGESCPMPGFGTLHPGANGTIAFRYEPDPSQLEGAGSVAEPRKPEPPKAAEAVKPETRTETRPASTPTTPSTPTAPTVPAEPAGESPAAKRTSAPAFTEPHVSPSAKMNPDPSIRGLRYGKPPKNTDAYTYVEHTRRRRGVDRFIWIAIIAAVLALAAIGYGYYRDLRERQLEEAEWIEFESAAAESNAPAASDTPEGSDPAGEQME